MGERTYKTWDEVAAELKAIPLETGDTVIYTDIKKKQHKVIYDGPANVLGYCKILLDGKFETVEISTIGKDLSPIEFNPMLTGRVRNKMENKNYSLDSILFLLLNTDSPVEETKKGYRIQNYTDNPFLIINNERIYYQRDLVWTIQQKRDLIQSIYDYNLCGTIVFRHRSYDWVQEQTKESDCAWIDIVDGKQRLNTIMEFMKDGFSDNDGNYYSQFSPHAKRMFKDHQLFSYREIPEGISDEDTLIQFLMINNTGVPQDENHMVNLKKLI